MTSYKSLWPIASPTSDICYVSATPRPGAGAWGDRGRTLGGIEEDQSFEASLELPAMRAEGLRRKQQTLILGEEEAPATMLTPNVRVASSQPGKSWDLTVEAESKPDTVRDRRRGRGQVLVAVGGSLKERACGSRWRFGSAPSAAPAAAVEPREEVRKIGSVVAEPCRSPPFRPSTSTDALPPRS